MVIARLPRHRVLVWFTFNLALAGVIYTFNRHRWSTNSFVVAEGPGLRDASNDVSRMTWLNNNVPKSQILAHIPGFTLIDHLFLMNGTFFIVTDNPETVPPRRFIMSAGLGLGAEAVANEPTAEMLSVISRAEAASLFGSFANRLNGVSFIQTDPSQFLTHFFHFVVEIVSQGLWRTYATLDLSISSSGDTFLPSPRRMIFPNTDVWEDRAGMNAFFLRAAFPSLTVYTETSFTTLTTSDPSPVYVFDRVVVGDRAAWHRAPNFRMPGFMLPFNVSKAYWSPVRKSIVNSSLALSKTPPLPSNRPVITYISRQQTDRRLTNSAHDRLLDALEELAQKYDYEFVEAYLEHMPKEEQVILCNRSTILVGVHGNGLSSALWMASSRRSTVIEILFPGGWSYGYQYMAITVGHKYYGIWNDRYFTLPEVEGDNQPEGFHGNDIPVDGSAVAALIHKRLSIPL